MHLDRVGWALRPAFAHALYLRSELEWAGRRVDPGEGITERILDAFAPNVRTFADVVFGRVSEVDGRATRTPE